MKNRRKYEKAILKWDKQNKQSKDKILKNETMIEWFQEVLKD